MLANLKAEIFGLGTCNKSHRANCLNRKRVNMPKNKNLTKNDVDVIYKDKFVELDKEKVETEKKLKGMSFDVVKSPDAVAILPILGNSILLERQYRTAINAFIYEIPAGHIEKSETSKQAAARELMEETGYVAKEMRFMFGAYTSPGYSTEHIDFYVAKGFVKGKPKRERTEIIRVEKMELKKALKLIAENKITDIKTIAGILYYVSLLRKQGKLEK